MKLSSSIRLDREFASFAATLGQQLNSAEPLPIAVSGLCEGALDAFVIEAVKEVTAYKRSAPCVLICEGQAEVLRLSELLLQNGIEADTYPLRELVFHNIRASHEIDRERLLVLSKILSGKCSCLITTLAASLEYTMPKEMLKELCLTVRVSSEISVDSLTKKLTALGFKRTQTVEAEGQFAIRGGIADLWQGGQPQPVRIEFFGDEIDRLAYFDPITQRVSGHCEGIDISAAAEVIVDGEAKERILKELDSLIKRAKSDTVRDRLTAEKEYIRLGAEIECRDKYLGLIYPNAGTLFDYLDSLKDAPAVFVINTNSAREGAKKTLDGVFDMQKEMLENGLISESFAKYTEDLKYFDNAVKNLPVTHINQFSGAFGERLSGLFGFRTRRTVMYGENPKMLSEDLISYRKNGYKVVLACENASGAESLRDALIQSDIYADFNKKAESIDIGKLAEGSIIITVADTGGFDLISPKVAILSMKRDSGRAIMRHRRQRRILKKVGGTEKIMSYADLVVGDCVVHASYGIGLFEGIESVCVDGVTKDYIKVKYLGTDRLFVPCDRLEVLGRYIGKKDDDGKVKLSKMGGGDWQKAKAKTKSAVKDIAKELIELYAKRQRTPGFAFSADTSLEEEFALSFGFEETASQLSAIEEIKADMCRPTPMNRLLCGDVGFGKTEVALRAAFKAIMDGKQVAFLVPTTILAMQHYQTALSRMRGYPVTVEMLSRFKTPRETARILKATKEGRVDILIGTHKLLSKKLEFRDLGLLIVDEEQRFGVIQKEKIKEMCGASVDVLTLTATPIPRTLNMAMNGISDMSVLDEAPGERFPVQTYVLEHDDTVIYDAIRKEMARGGQTLYVHNKIDDIDLIAGHISENIPACRVAYAHGQMDKDEIEDIWHTLVEGEIDVLVCTTIIETGVDLPNANTLIIDNADRMGLSQLHQIRGRVGRSVRQAYAYFTYPRGKALTENQTKRLETIKEFAEFGAGFRVALRDLEIRGAGNLLGAEQHGYIDSVGYELYIEMLNEAVLLEKGIAKEKPFESSVDIKLDAHIPEYYISSASLRMQMYKRISHIRTEEDFDDVLDELIDRFGTPPRATENLLSIALIRAMLESYEIPKVSLENGCITFVLGKARLDIWAEVIDKCPGLVLRAGKASVVYMKLKPGKSALGEILRILRVYKKYA